DADVGRQLGLGILPRILHHLPGGAPGNPATDRETQDHGQRDATGARPEPEYFRRSELLPFRTHVPLLSEFLCLFAPRIRQASSKPTECRTRQAKYSSLVLENRCVI